MWEMRRQASDHTGKRRALSRIAAAYVGAIVLAALWLSIGPHTDWLWLDTLIADAFATVVIFIASRVHRNSSFYDAYWSVAPPLIVTTWWAYSDRRATDPVAWALLIVIAVWAVRLTANWIRTFSDLHHEDWRYPLVRSRAGHFEFGADLIGIHLVPTMQVFAALTPAYVVFDNPTTRWPSLVIGAALVGCAAITIEWVADRQLHTFAISAAPGACMNRGLWGLSRHPNYVGEWLMWVSIALFGIAVAPQQAWWCWLGAAAILAMFLGASIPMMEQRSRDRRPSYAEVVADIPMFFPVPRLRGGSRM